MNRYSELRVKSASKFFSKNLSFNIYGSQKKFRRRECENRFLSITLTTLSHINVVLLRRFTKVDEADTIDIRTSVITSLTLQ